MLNIINNLVVIFFCILCMTCSLGNNEDGVTTYHTIINGTIIDEDTKIPIEDVKVDLKKSSKTFLGTKRILTIYTDNEGKFYIDNNCTINDRYSCSFSLEINKHSYHSITSFQDIETGTENSVTIYLNPKIK